MEWLRLKTEKTVTKGKKVQESIKTNIRVKFKSPQIKTKRKRATTLSICLKRAKPKEIVKMKITNVLNQEIKAGVWVIKVIAVIKWRKLREKLRKTSLLMIRPNHATKLIRINKFNKVVNVFRNLLRCKI